MKLLPPIILVLVVATLTVWVADTCIGAMTLVVDHGWSELVLMALIGGPLLQASHM